MSHGQRDGALVALNPSDHRLVRVFEKECKLLLREPRRSSVCAQVISEPRHNACRLKFADGHAVNDAPVRMPVLCTTICQLGLNFLAWRVKIP